MNKWHTSKKRTILVSTMGPIWRRMLHYHVDYVMYGWNSIRFLPKKHCSLGFVENHQPKISLSHSSQWHSWGGLQWLQKEQSHHSWSCWRSFRHVWILNSFPHEEDHQQRGEHNQNLKQYESIGFLYLTQVHPKQILPEVLFSKQKQTEINIIIILILK